MLRTTLRLAMTALLVTSAVASPQTRSRYYSYPPSPQGDLLLARPELSWSVWGVNGLEIKSVGMELDGAKLKAVYDKKTRSVSAHVPRNLAPDTYKVVTRVVFSTDHEVEKSWKFKVLPGALNHLPSPDSQQAIVQRAVDRIRQSHSLSTVTVDLALSAAAKAHAQYMTINGTSGHKEKSGTNGFTGISPGERARVFGYSGRNSEAVATSQRGIAHSVRLLFDAPYHRVIFLQPARPDFGGGFSDGALCIKFGGETGSGAIASPPEGARNVPSAWDGIETPDPLRKTRLSGPVGYPIMLSTFGEDAKQFKYVSATLTDSYRKTVPTITLHPGNDQYLKSSVVLVPREPLQKGDYRCTVVYKNSKGQAMKSWRFTVSSTD